MYKVLKYAITNIMSAEHAPRALDWYRGLIERFFALPSRTEAQEAAVVTKAENHAKVTTVVQWCRCIQHACWGN